MFLPDTWLDNKEVEIIIIRRVIKNKALVLFWIEAITKFFTFSYLCFWLWTMVVMCNAYGWLQTLVVFI